MKSPEQKVGVWAVYRQMLRSCPGLGWRLAAQSAVLMLGRACVAWGALLVASAVDERASAEAAVAGAAGLYAACRALEWFLGCLHSRMHASGALPAAFEFCDQAVEAALSDPEPGVDPARLAKRMDQKAQARAALGFLFHHIAPPAFELAICSVALSRLGFGWLAWALAPAAAAHMWLAVSLSPKIKALAAKALGGAEASQAMASQAFESAALARSYGSQGVLAKMLREQSARELKAFKRQSLASEAALAVGSLALAGWAALFFGAGLCFVRAGEASPGAFAALRVCRDRFSASSKRWPSPLMDCSPPPRRWAAMRARCRIGVPRQARPRLARRANWSFWIGAPCEAAKSKRACRG